MRSVLALPRRRALPIAPKAVLGVIAIVAFCVLALVVLVPAMEGPSFIDRLTVENPHPWTVNIHADNPSRDGWVGIGILERESSKTFLERIDHGERWVFRFSYAGIEGGELELTRTQLERSAWKITVPDEFARRMRAAGVGPSA